MYIYQVRITEKEIYMAEKITNLIFEFEQTLFEKDGSLKHGVEELMIWLRFHRFGVGLVSDLPEEKVGEALTNTDIGEYFEQGVCKEQMERDDKNPYLVSRDELNQVEFIKMGANEEEAFALSEAVEAYAVTASEEGVRKAHAAGCYTILIMDPEGEYAVSPEAQMLAECIFPNLEDFTAWLEAMEHRPTIELEALDHELSVCKLKDFKNIDLERNFYFIGKTDEEYSLVCKTEDAPEVFLERNDGWRGFRVRGTLDFSLVGILSQLTGILAKHRIGIFAVSTFNTDYILTKEDQFARALQVLREAGYTID